jgi:hypothetical protein
MTTKDVLRMQFSEYISSPGCSDSAKEVPMTYRSISTAERNVRTLEDFRGGRRRTKSRAKGRNGRKFDKRCMKKTRFRSREHAIEALHSFKYQARSASHDGVASRIPIRAYQCNSKLCNGGWHLTSKPEFTPLSIEGKQSA